MNLNIVLFILILFLGLIHLYNESNKEKTKHVPNWILILTFILLILVASIQVIIEYNKEVKDIYSKDSGILSENKVENQTITYLLGSNFAIGFQNQSIFGKNGVFNIGNCENDILYARIENGVLKISSYLYDKEGHVVAKIKDNEWTVNPKYIWDKNFDDEAFEVVNDNDEVILQIIINETAVRIHGDFFCNNERIFINDEGVFLNSENQLPIHPIFKYPAIDHTGERIVPMK